MHRTLCLLPLVLLAAVVPAGAQEPISVGQTVSGELASSDRKDPDGKLFDTWSFNARAGVTYVVTLRSDDFDSFLRVGPTDDGGCPPCLTDDDWLGSDARVVLQAETDGTRIIRATTYEVGESGFYTLSVEDVEPLPAPGAAPAPAPASRGGGVLQSGVAATGVLDEEDRRAPYNPGEQNSLYDVWWYLGRAGESLTLSLRSDDFDTFLRVYRWEGGRWQPLASNDDDERLMTGNSRVVVTLPADGEYQVHAAAYRETATGTYTLTANDPAAAPAAPIEQPEYIVPGWKLIGELAAGDSVADDGTFYDVYRYHHAFADTMIFQLLTAEIDAVLRIGVRENGVWREVARDDGARGSRSKLTFALPRAMYELRVGTRGPGRTGAYVLVPDTSTHDGYERLPEPTIIPGQTRAGRLEPGDSVGEAGVLEDVYTLVAEGLTTFHLRSGDFDPLVEVQARLTSGQWMVVARGDDRGTGPDSRVTHAVSPHLRYRVRVTPRRRGQGGAYTLVASRTQDFDAGTPPAPISAGQTLRGRLEETDSRDADGTFRDEWTFRGRPGETVIVTLRSDDFNPLVQVGRMVNGQWEKLKEEDGTVDTRDAALIIPLPEEGEYRIRASSHRPGETGAYTLTLESGRFY